MLPSPSLRRRLAFRSRSLEILTPLSLSPPFPARYILRRTRERFRELQHEPDSSAVTAAFAQGVADLGVARRQSVVYGLFAHHKSVMESPLEEDSEPGPSPPSSGPPFAAKRG